MDRDQATRKETDREKFTQQEVMGEEKKELSKNFEMSGIFMPWHHIAIVIPFWFRKFGFMNSKRKWHSLHERIQCIPRSLGENKHISQSPLTRLNHH